MITKTIRKTDAIVIIVMYMYCRCSYHKQSTSNLMQTIAAPNYAINYCY